MLYMYQVISIGEFTIDWHLVDLDDVYIVQQNHLVMDILCRVAGPQLELLEQMFCKCLRGIRDSAESHGVVPQSSSIMSRSYCSYRPCDSRLAMNDCIVSIDPFRHACIVTSNVNSLPTSAITYSHKIPTTGYLGQSLVLLIESFLTHVDDIPSLSPYADSVKEVANYLGRWSSHLLNYCPQHLANAAVGIGLLVYSDELAGSKLFQYSLAGALGLFLALAWLLLTIYR